MKNKQALYKETLQMRLRAAYFAMHRNASRFFAPYETTADQYVLLTYLTEQDGITQQELMRRCNSDPRTVGLMIDLLEKKGFVERRSDPSDRRAWLINMTPKGRKQQLHLKRESEIIREQLYSAVDPKDLPAVLKALDRIATVFGDPKRSSKLRTA